MTIGAATEPAFYLNLDNHLRISDFSYHRLSRRDSSKGRIPSDADHLEQLLNSDDDDLIENYNFSKEEKELLRFTVNQL